MRNKEVELIASLAEDRLEDETEARALVASSPKHQAEYDAQKTAYQALSAIPSAQLTEHESAALHRDIWTELQSQPIASTAKAPWYYRWSYAAAGLFVVVGLVVVVDQTNPDFAPTALLSSEDAAVTETSAQSSSGLDDASRVAEDDGATDTTESGDDSGAIEQADGASAYVAPNKLGLADLAVQTRNGELKSADLAATNFDEAMVEDMTQCITQASLLDHKVVGDVEVENHYIVAVPTDTELGPETPVSFVDANTCELVHTEG